MNSMGGLRHPPSPWAGELVCRLLCVLAQDNLLQKQLYESNTCRPRYTQPFNVLDVLGCRFKQSETIIDNEKATAASGKKKLHPHESGSSIAKTYPELLHGFLRQQAALQQTYIHRNQTTWHLLSPMFLGRFRPIEGSRR
jgi:hypothetical protein